MLRLPNSSKFLGVAMIYSYHMCLNSFRVYICTCCSHMFRNGSLGSVASGRLPFWADKALCYYPVVDISCHCWPWPGDQGHLLLTWITVTLIPTWISNYIHYKVWDEITYPFPNFSGTTIEIWKWISNYIPRIRRIGGCYGFTSKPPAMVLTR